MAAERFLYLNSHGASLWFAGPAAPAPEIRFAGDDLQASARLADYLVRHAPDAIIRVVLDLPGETLHVDTAPKVGLRDRQRWALRRLAALLPQPQLRTLRWQHQRGMHRALLAGFADPQAVLDWLEPLLAASIPIASVQSLALLADHLPGRLGLRLPRLLLVSHTGDGCLRYAWFRDGILHLGRLVQLENDDAIEAGLVRETRVVLDYLASIQQTGLNDRTTVLVLTAPGLQPATGMQFGDRIDVVHAGIGECARRLKLPATNDSRAFWLMLARQGRNDYGRFALRRYWQYRQLRQGLTMTAVIACGMAAGIGAMSTWYIRQLDAERQQLAEQALQVQQTAAAIRLPAHIPAADVRALVENSRAIRQHMPLPDELMQRLLAVLADTPAFRLVSLDWQPDHHQPLSKGQPVPALPELDLRQPLGNWARLALQPARPAAPYRDQLAGFASLQARLQSAGLQVHQPSPPINVAPTAVLDGRHPLLDAQARFMLTVRLPPATHAKTAR